MIVKTSILWYNTYGIMEFIHINIVIITKTQLHLNNTNAIIEIINI